MGGRAHVKAQFDTDRGGGKKAKSGEDLELNWEESRGYWLGGGDGEKNRVLWGGKSILKVDFLCKESKGGT